MNLDYRATLESLLDDPTRAFTVELWDGSTLPPRDGQPTVDRVILRAPEVATCLFPPVTETDIAKAFIRGDIEIAGDTVSVVEQAARWRGPPLRLSAIGGMAKRLADGLLHHRRSDALRARLRGRTHSTDRDAKAIQHHYDVSDEFYRLFLDEEMVYSCAFFPTGHESLAEAQRAKLELVCRKLDLQRGDRFLDVGCGWGALIDHAARRHGARALGITISERQFIAAHRRAARCGDGWVDVLLCDFRDLPRRTFDKAASVGMMEHVGRRGLQKYFESIHAHLRPGGLFLNTAVSDVAPGVHAMSWMSQHSGGFIGRYIFPDSDLVPIHIVVREAEHAGFEVRDLECMREHYAETLELWLSNLESHFDRAVAVVGRARARAWRLYLASSAVAFRAGSIGVYQLLLAKRTPDGARCDVPRRRSAWYDGGGSDDGGERRYTE